MKIRMLGVAYILMGMVSCSWAAQMAQELRYDVGLKRATQFRVGFRQSVDDVENALSPEERARIKKMRSDWTRWRVQECLQRHPHQPPKDYAYDEGWANLPMKLRKDLEEDLFELFERAGGCEKVRKLAGQ